MRRRALARDRATRNSNHLASQTVHVTSEAKASPIITPFTMMSALRNMPHGDRSCGSSAAPTSGRLDAVGAAAAGTAGAAGAAAEAAGAVASCCAHTDVVQAAIRRGTRETLVLRLVIIPPLRAELLLPIARAPTPCGWRVGAAR